MADIYSPVFYTITNNKRGLEKISFSCAEPTFGLLFYVLKQT